MRPKKHLIKTMTCLVMMVEISKKFKGNKSYLQTKDCVVCGKPFSCRKKWAKNWQQITKCSKRCRAVNN